MMYDVCDDYIIILLLYNIYIFRFAVYDTR
jgi:hypothetical protein